MPRSKLFVATSVCAGMEDRPRKETVDVLHVRRGAVCGSHRCLEIGQVVTDNAGFLPGGPIGDQQTPRCSRRQ